MMTMVIAARKTTVAADATEEAATAASEMEECSGGEGHCKVCRDESGVRGLPENHKS